MKPASARWWIRAPIPNRPIEGWPLFHYLDPEEFRSFFGYAKRYCGASQGAYGWDFSGAGDLAGLQKKLRESIMIRRLKADVLTELPAKRRAVIEIAANGSTGAVKAELAAWEANEDRMFSLRAAMEMAKASADPEDYARAVAALSLLRNRTSGQVARNHAKRKWGSSCSLSASRADSLKSAKALPYSFLACQHNARMAW